jgi:hypothetical protein
MPNPKSGTVSDDIPKTIKEVKAGRVEFKMDKTGNIVVVVGKKSFTAQQISENAAVALAAGFLFANPLVAASVPLAALAISNVLLPGYGSLGVAAVVYAATAWPVLLGTCGILGRDRPRWLAVVGGSLATSLVFFVSTNLAHWAFTADYSHTLAGLGECFVAALPFYRWMPVGDAAWTVATFGLIMAARMAAEAAATRRLRPEAVSPRPLD